MNVIFNNLKNLAGNAIRFAKDDDLSNNNFSNNLLKELDLEFPILDINNSKFDIKKRVIDHHNAPNNFLYTAGKTYESYFASMPIKNNNYFQSIFPLISNNSFTYNGRELIYEELSQDSIEGNSVNILNLRENFKIKFDILKNSLEQQKIIFDSFIKNDLREYIDEMISNETTKRKVNKESKDLLNPFK